MKEDQATQTTHELCNTLTWLTARLESNCRDFALTYNCRDSNSGEQHVQLLRELREALTVADRTMVRILDLTKDVLVRL